MRNSPGSSHEWKTSDPVSVSPSPKSQEVNVGEFVDSLASPIVCPTSTTVGRFAITACGGRPPGTTVMTALSESEPSALVAVKVTSNDPGSSKTLVTDVPTSVVPSPKVQNNVSGSPVLTLVNVSGSPTSIVSLTNVKSALGGSTISGATTVKLCVCSAWSPASLVMNMVTVKTPSSSHTLTTSGPSALVPSPKSQFHCVGSPVESSASRTSSPASKTSAENEKFATSASSLPAISAGSTMTGALTSSATSAPSSSPSTSSSPPSPTVSASSPPTAGPASPATAFS